MEGELSWVDTEAPYGCDWTVPAGPGIKYRIEARAQELGGRTDTDFVDVTAE